MYYLQRTSITWLQRPQQAYVSARILPAIAARTARLRRSISPQVFWRAGRGRPSQRSPQSRRAPQQAGAARLPLPALSLHGPAGAVPPGSTSCARRRRHGVLLCREALAVFVSWSQLPSLMAVSETCLLRRCLASLSVAEVKFSEFCAVWGSPGACCPASLCFLVFFLSWATTIIVLAIVLRELGAMWPLLTEGRISSHWLQLKS